MSKRERFSRSCIASSRGPYVRRSHYLLIQERLAERGIVANLEDIIEASIIISIKPKYYTKCFGKKIYLSESQARTLGPELIIKL